ncbi:ABC transporter ATP-binding protein [Enterococcus gallinarum]|uniref:ABC transporter ATP-binding protein n=1 Tax=Enterococcus gallinarum TaxID=1353 RepID=A0ABD4HQL5_ENTGA|nr:ABC transporter ATP-binding protein [Enterococcus gallinarum]MBA0949405.1 ABC transporter ATP-binding protein [Enterococcus gallinarum]MBA0962402.1 ABC transporter ATP-binding protein [Enterococcus gallinarum]MBA0970337.1 ABC transporter ATP-binding protein [Enterococcus gallinarum]MBA0973727.1 ABC transporter ATP-binding protein [Enterococcus gallinarum]MBO6419496.1 ABC transporter ATP-binding protein [Enterococcus gallinarum]
MPLLSIQQVKKVYQSQLNGQPVEALKNITFSVEEGEYVAIMGESGSGKSTLLNLMATLDQPTAGDLALNGIDLTTIKEKDAASFRRDHLGFVFQDFNLLDTFSVKDNILLPLVLSKVPVKQMDQRLQPLVRTLGITDLLQHYPYELSGGQKQRVAVARAIITKPDLLLADEPTGALDSKTSDQLLTLFQQINQNGQTIIMVTHSSIAASRAQRVLFIKDGHVFHQLYRGERTNSAFLEAISETMTAVFAREE